MKELRLAGISTIVAANAWLPGLIVEHNARFGRAPRTPRICIGRYRRNGSSRRPQTPAPSTSRRGPRNQARSEPSICTSRPDTRVAGAADAGRAGVVADRAKGPAAITPHARSRARSCSRGAPPASPLPGPAKNRHTGSRAIDSARLRMASKRSQEPAAPSTEEVLSKHRGKPTPRRVR